MEFQTMNQNEVDEKATMKKIKQAMHFLSEYAWMIKDQDMLVEDELDIMDFISYTRSVIDIKEKTHPKELSILHAMEQRDRAQLRQDKRMKQLELLFHAISFLPKNEQKCVKMKYIDHESMLHIASNLNVSTSTAHRILNKAYLHLAQLLDMEVMKG